MFVAALALFALGALFVPFVSLGVAVAGLLMVSALLLWGSARRLQERVEQLVVGIFGAQEPIEQAKLSEGSRDQLVQLIWEEYPWEVETQDLLLPYQESAVFLRFSVALPHPPTI